MALALGTLVLLLSLPAAAPIAQDGPAHDGPTPSAPGGHGWRVLDGVAGQAGDHIITIGELAHFVEQRSKQVGIKIGSDEERAGYLREALAPVILQELETQAGEDLGLDPARVERAVRLTLDERRRELGPQHYRDFLQEEGEDAIGIGLKQTDSIYRQAWIGKQLGYDNTGTERPIRDRYVRPGELRAIYRTNKNRLGDPARVRFQDLLFPVEAVGGDVERARAVVTNAREKALGGEDFDTLVEQWGFSNQEALGVTEWLEAPRLRDEYLRTFALEGEVGSYTEVLPIVERGETVAFHVVKLLEREEGRPVPGFEDQNVQAFLRREYMRDRDAKILDKARAQLDKSAYTWRAEGWEEPVTAKGPAAASPAAATP